MSKSLKASALIVLVLISCFPQVYQYAAYSLNTGYITSNFCVNIAKPKMHCNGKCYLAKKVKEAEKSRQKTVSGKFSLSVFVKPVNDFLFFSPVIQSLQVTACKIKGNKVQISIFHPPPRYSLSA